MRLVALFLLAACARSETDLAPDTTGTPSEDGGGDGEGGGDDGSEDESNDDDDPGDPGDDVDDTGDDPEDEEDDLPSEYTYDEEEVEPLLDLDAVEDAMSAGISTLMSANPYEVFDVTEEVIEAGDEDLNCPYLNQDYVQLYGYEYWYGGCTSEEDIYYDGTIYGIDNDPYVSGYYDYRHNAWWYADWSASYPDGQAFDIGGYFRAYEYVYTYYSYRYNYVSFTGDVSWSGADHADTWFGDGASVDYTLNTMWYPGYGSYVNLTGGLSSLDGDATTVHFDSFYIGTGNYSDCPSEPSGTVSIRDADGEWYQAMFDGPAYSGAAVFTPDCDGCGDVWYRGEMLGEVCPNFSPVVNWEDTTW